MKAPGCNAVITVVPVVPMLASLLALACICPTARGEEHAYQEITSWISSTKASTRTLPGLTEMSAKLKTAGDRLSPAERGKIWEDWLAAQRPAMSKEELIAAAKARKASMQTVNLKYSAAWKMAGSDRQLQWYSYEEAHFLMDGVKLKLEENHGPNDTTLKTPHVTSFDGSVVRQVYPNAGLGWISPFESRQPFFGDAWSPLAQQMLSDTEAIGSAANLVTVLESEGVVAAHVLETPEVIDGRKALVCSTGYVPRLIVWLDPERNFAVLKMQENGIKWSDDGHPTEVYPEIVEETSGFMDCGGGFWLPKETVIKRFSPDGTLTQQIVIKVSEAQINQAVPQGQFTDIFPKGIRIMDSSNASQLVAALSDLKSQTQGLESSATPPAPRPAPARRQEAPSGRPVATLWIIAAVVCILALALLVWKIRQSRRD